MKKLRSFISIFIICFTITTMIPTQFDYLNFSLKAEAHRGNTDRNGGHKDNKNKSGLGPYHYHCNGKPAHLHQNGVCPYANDNNTAFSDSRSSASTNSAGNTSSSSAASNPTVQNSITPKIPSTEDNAETLAIKVVDTSYDNAAFNASYYASNNADVYEACGNDAKALYNHFIEYGIKEGRQSAEQFSIFVYKENNQDLYEAFGDDLMKYYDHFIEYGVNENRVSK